MSRIAVVGNATRDVNRVGPRSVRRPGGTVLYASLALAALGHDVHPIGHAPLRALGWLRRAGIDVSGLEIAWPGTQFLNEYDGEHRTQWARRGPERALESGAALGAFDAVLLGPVLREVPEDLEVPAVPVSLLDVQGSVRRVGPRNLYGWRPVTVEPNQPRLPRTTHVRGSLEEVSQLTGLGDAEACARSLSKLTGAVSIITLGSKGALGYDGAFHQAPARPVTADDPTGAGDVFDAGLLHGLVTGRPLADALALGCAAAGLFLERPWTRVPLARFGTPNEVQAWVDAIY